MRSVRGMLGDRKAVTHIDPDHYQIVRLPLPLSLSLVHFYLSESTIVVFPFSGTT